MEHKQSNPTGYCFMVSDTSDLLSVKSVKIPDPWSSGSAVV